MLNYLKSLSGDGLCTFVPERDSIAQNLDTRGRSDQSVNVVASRSLSAWAIAVASRKSASVKAEGVTL